MMTDELSPIERDRELGHRALLKYLEAAGFSALEDEPSSPQEEIIHRFANRGKTVIAFHEQKKAYVVESPAQRGKYVTRNPHSIITHVERLLEEGESS